MSKRFSKILGIAIVLCMIMGLSACGPDPKTPKGATEAFLKDLQKGDIVVWQEQLSGRKLSDDEKKQIQKNFKESPHEDFDRMKDFKFKIVDSKEVKKNKEAEVTVEFETYDFVKVTQRMNEYFSKNMNELKSMKENKLNKTIDKKMKEEYKKADKRVKNKAKIMLTYNKKKGEWKVVDPSKNFEFQDALMGGFLTYQSERSQNLQPKTN